MIMIGRLEWIKGIELTLIALRNLKRIGAKAELIIVGDGAEESKMKFLTHALNLADDVSFLGALRPNQVKEVLSTAHVLICSSWSEGISNSVLEAKATGVAVVSANVGGMSEVINHKISGQIFEIGNVNDLTERLMDYYVNNEERLKITNMARLEAEASHDLNSQIQQFISVYQDLIQSPANK